MHSRVQCTQSLKTCKIGFLRPQLYNNLSSREKRNGVEKEGRVLYRFAMFYFLKKKKDS